MNREILRLAIPNILSNISVPLLSTVDTALMGRLTELHIGAVGVGAMIFNFVYWNFGFLRMGTTGLTAQAFGAREEDTLTHTLGRALLIAMILAMLILALQVPLGELGFLLMNISSDQLPLVREYFYIRVWAAPATLASYALFGWLFGMQNAIYPLFLTLLVNIVNVALSAYFVYFCGMETAGVAYGTLIAQYVGLAAGLGLLAYRYSHLWPRLRMQVLLYRRELQRFLVINGDIFLRTFALTFVFGFFYSKSASEGEMILAVNVILLQFLNWMSYGVDGFAFAAESLVGKYAGARDTTGTRRLITLSFFWGMGLAALYSVAYGAFGPALLRIFTDQVNVIHAATPYLFWMAVFPLLSTPCYLWDGIFIGLTASRAMRNSMILALLFFLAVYFPLQSRFDNHGLWAALLIFMIARGALQYGLFAWRGAALR